MRNLGVKDFFSIWQKKKHSKRRSWGGGKLYIYIYICVHVYIDIYVHASVMFSSYGPYAMGLGPRKQVS